MIVIIAIAVFVIISGSMLLTCILAEMCYVCIIIRHYGDVLHLYNYAPLQRCDMHICTPLLKCERGAARSMADVVVVVVVVSACTR